MHYMIRTTGKPRTIGVGRLDDGEEADTERVGTWVMRNRRATVPKSLLITSSV